MIPRQSIDLILSSEGLDQPGKWPGGASGITIGHGYDLGYTDLEEFLRDWDQHLSRSDREQLMAVCGFKGQAARRIAPTLAGIKISRGIARKVFDSATLPKWFAATNRAFPGAHLLPAAAFGALVSLVFNRGASCVDKPGSTRRREMRAIRDAITKWAALRESTRAAGLRPLLLVIAAQIRSMKRLWIGKGLDGLLTRREREAVMVESAAA